MSDQPDQEFRYINESFEAESVTNAQLDTLLADGWRHFGTTFFRYNLNLHKGEVVRVLPLRIRLDSFQISRSQRRVIRRNSDLTIVIEPANINDEINELFDRHKYRFDHGVPETIYDFLSLNPATMPTPCQQMIVRNGDGKLLAASFFDSGEISTSAIYACFDPDEEGRSLGIFTMLKVIEHAIDTQKIYYYHGYSYDVPSFYDYKKRFSGSEQFDWNGGWLRL